MRWPLTFYVTGWPLKSWMAGAAFGPVTFIRKGYEADEGLRQHELTHVKQAVVCALIGALAGFAAATYFPAYLGWLALWGTLVGFGVNGLIYLLVRPYRLFAEAQAYAAQMCFPDRKGGYLTLGLAVYRLRLPQYDLQLTPESAESALVVAVAAGGSKTGPNL